jgi:hypothetical protein
MLLRECDIISDGVKGLHSLQEVHLVYVSGIYHYWLRRVCGTRYLLVRASRVYLLLLMEVLSSGATVKGGLKVYRDKWYFMLMIVRVY